MNYSIPETLDDALTLAQAHPDSVFVAGGTDLMVQRIQGNNAASHLIDLNGIAALHRITASDDEVVIGAGVTLVEIIRHRLLGSTFPELVEAARSVASPLIQTSATIGGNLLCENRCIYFDQSEFWRNAIGYCLKCGGDVCIATGGTKNCFSVFISDIAPVLICLDARVEYFDADGVGTIPVEELYSGDGRRPHTLAREAILTRIVIPLPVEGTIFFRKVRPRASVDFTNLTLAVRLGNGTLTAAASGLGPGPAVIHMSEMLAPEAVAAALLARTQIIDNLSYTRFYRREMLRTLIREAVAAWAE
jgi:4-hydroxybenzoyl-CoA reductase subunit beta